MNYFPDKPWNVGDEFENETTGVTYRYDGTKWVATGDSDPLVEYLPITGGEVTGPLLVNNLLEVKEDTVEYQKNRTSITQMSSREIINAGILDNLMRSPNDGYLKGLATEEYVDNAIGNIKVTNSFRKLKFARDKDWNNIRPGEFGLMDKDNNFVGQWSQCDQVFFSAVDTDGNRLVKDENAKDYVTELGSALSVFTSSGERPIMRLTPSHETLNGFVQMEYVKDLDIFWVGWLSDMVKCIQTATNDNLSNAQNFLFNIPDLFL